MRNSTFFCPPISITISFKTLTDKHFILLTVYLGEQSSAKRRTIHTYQRKLNNQTKKSNPPLTGQKKIRVTNVIHQFKCLVEIPALSVLVAAVAQPSFCNNSLDSPFSYGLDFLSCLGLQENTDLGVVRGQTIIQEDYLFTGNY